MAPNWKLRQLLGIFMSRRAVMAPSLEAFWSWNWYFLRSQSIFLRKILIYLRFRGTSKTSFLDVWENAKKLAGFEPQDPQLFGYIMRMIWMSSICRHEIHTWIRCVIGSFGMFYCQRQSHTLGLWPHGKLIWAKQHGHKYWSPRP